jgi:hypothetical protein
MLPLNIPKRPRLSYDDECESLARHFLRSRAWTEEEIWELAQAFQNAAEDFLEEHTREVL